jgi:DNA-binding LacI/PurR family transcriptional regulator
MSKSVTLKEVAAKAGVSYQTVSKVIHGKAHVSANTEARIWEAIRALNYHPNSTARNLRHQRSQMIGYSWRRVPSDQFNPVLEKFLQSMIETAASCDYYILPFAFPENNAQIDVYQELIQTRRVDGFILSSTNLNDRRIQFLQQAKIPFVAFGRANPDWDFPYIDVDGSAGIVQAVNYLYNLGHRRIAIIAWPESSLAGSNRLSGYFEGMHACGIEPDPLWIARGEHSAAFGRQATAGFLRLEACRRPTAIIAISDLMAVGAMLEIQDRGLEIPRDLSVIGFDDVPMAQYLRPSLTTLRQPIWEIGQLAIENLLQQIHGESFSEKKLLPPELILRDSCTSPL